MGGWDKDYHQEGSNTNGEEPKQGTQKDFGKEKETGRRSRGPVEMDNMERKGSEPGQREAAPQGENMQDNPTIETLKEKHPHVNIVPKLCFKFVFTLIHTITNKRGDLEARIREQDPGVECLSGAHPWSKLFS